MNVDTGEKTGRTSAGTSDYSYGWADPETPEADVQVVAEKRTELRVVPADVLYEALKAEEYDGPAMSARV